VVQDGHHCDAPDNISQQRRDQEFAEMRLYEDVAMLRAYKRTLSRSDSS
jgi:hypothetical protein